MLAPGHGAKQLEKLCSHQLPSCFGLIFSIYGPEFGLRPLFCAELRQMFLPVFLRPALTGTIHRPYVWWDLSQHVQHFWLFTCCMSNCFILEPWGQGPVQNKVVQVRTEYMHVVSNRDSRDIPILLRFISSAAVPCLALATAGAATEGCASFKRRGWEQQFRICAKILPCLSLLRCFYLGQLAVAFKRCVP